jgi:uncharacterized protein YcaQ
MADNRLHIGNSQLRQLWLAAHGLASAPSGAVDVMSIIRRLGFLQIDTVRNVVRAQDHILWSRNHRYREDMVWDALRRRELFEHFTHDASLIPMDVYPLWQRQFHRLGEKAARAEWYQSGLAQAETEAIHARIKAEGPRYPHMPLTARVTALKCGLVRRTKRRWNRCGMPVFWERQSAAIL